MAESGNNGWMTGLLVLGGVALGAGIAYLIIKRRQQAEQTPELPGIHPMYYDPPEIKQYPSEYRNYDIMAAGHPVPNAAIPALETHYKNDEETVFRRNSDGFIESFKVIRDARQAAVPG